MSNKDFFDMLNTTTTQRFLRATPFSVSDGVNFNGKLTEEMFFDEFYADTKEAENCKKNILKSIRNNSDSIVVLIGYSGCGKTTFLHYLLREKKDKMYLFDFEKGIDNQHDEPILSKIQKDFNRVIVYDIINNNHRIFNKFYSLFYKDSYENNSVVTEHIDLNRNIQNFVNAFHKKRIFDDIIKKIYDENDSECKIIIDQLISSYLKKMDYLEILGFFLLWDIATDLFKKSINPTHEIGAIFCFDNIDNIDNTDKTKEFIKHFAQFHISMRQTLKALDLSDYYDIGEDSLIDKYTYIISYRETTYAKLTEHLNETSKYIYDDRYISELYGKKEIVSKRNNFLIQNKNRVPQKLFASVDIIEKLLNNSYIEKNIFPLFNNSYNIAIKTTCHICESNIDYIQEYYDICKKDGGKYTRGANGLILRLFFDYFKEKHYFEKIQLFDFNSPSEYSFSPARLVLTFLNNQKSATCMYDIYSYFDGIISPEDITKTIDEIYMLRFSEWRHLLTFNKYPPTDANGLQSQLDLYNEHKPISETRKLFSTLEITCAGRTYLKSMSTNFEFYASRIFGDTYAPLFSKQNIEPSSMLFKKIIRKVFENVTQCIERLYYLDSKIMGEKNLDINEYCKSDFVYKNKTDLKLEKQFHGERIIFNHIGYINRFRQYILSTHLDLGEKTSCNKFIAQYILNYLNLYENNKCTKSGINSKVALELKEQAEHVLKNPTDFFTSIETSYYRKKHI